jgi:predicted permease
MCLIVFLGMILKKTRLITDALLDTATVLLYIILLPSVFIHAITAPGASVTIQWEFIAPALLAIILVFLSGLLYAFLFKLVKEQTFIFSMSNYRSDVSLGVTLIYFLFDQEILKMFCVFLLIIIIATNILTVLSSIWLLPHSKIKRDILRLIIRSIVLNPIIIAGVLGVLIAEKIFSLPGFVTNLINFIYPATFPISLILTGAMVCEFRTAEITVQALVGSILKTIFLPLFGYLIVMIVQSSGEMVGVTIIFLCLPYMLDRKPLQVNDNLRKEATSPYYNFSIVFSFIMLSIVIKLL